MAFGVSNANFFPKLHDMTLSILIFSFLLDITGISPAEYFGSAYESAVEYCNKNMVTFSDYFKDTNIDPKIAISVVFPEIVRYNRFYDIAEFSMLELLYVRKGKGWSDFSVGTFQMKPSFVENLEKIVVSDTNSFGIFTELTKYYNRNSLQDIRKERISRLKNSNWQMRYLYCFLFIAKHLFAEELFQNPTEELLILSSAYNLGLNSSYEQLKSISKRKYFPYGKIITCYFSYYDVALSYYKTLDNN